MMSDNINFSNFRNELDSEKNFQKVAQTVGSNIQKISQNGTLFLSFICGQNPEVR